MPEGASSARPVRRRSQNINALRFDSALPFRFAQRRRLPSGQVLLRCLFGDESLHVQGANIASMSVGEHAQPVTARNRRIEFLHRELHAGKNGWPADILNEAIESQT